MLEYFNLIENILYIQLTYIWTSYRYKSVHFWRYSRNIYTNIYTFYKCLIKSIDIPTCNEHKTVICRISCAVWIWILNIKLNILYKNHNLRCIFSYFVLLVLSRLYIFNLIYAARGERVKWMSQLKTINKIFFPKTLR